MTTARRVKRIGTWTSIGLVTVVVIVVAGLYIFSGSIVGPAPELFSWKLSLHCR